MVDTDLQQELAKRHGFRRGRSNEFYIAYEFIVEHFVDMDGNRVQFIYNKVKGIDLEEAIRTYFDFADCMTRFNGKEVVIADAFLPPGQMGVVYKNHKTYDERVAKYTERGYTEFVRVDKIRETRYPGGTTKTFPVTVPYRERVDHRLERVERGCTDNGSYMGEGYVVFEDGFYVKKPYPKWEEPTKRRRTK